MLYITLFLNNIFGGEGFFWMRKVFFRFEKFVFFFLQKKIRNFFRFAKCQKKNKRKFNRIGKVGKQKKEVDKRLNRIFRQIILIK